MAITGQDLIPESGGYDNFSGPIVQASFQLAGEDYPKGANGEIAVMLQCQVDSDAFEKPVRLGGFKVGDDTKWQISDDGREVTPLKGGPKFNAKSSGGVFVAELIRVAGNGKIEDGANILAARGFLTTQAGFYEGLDSHWVKREFENPVDKSRTINVQVATEYVKIAGKAEAKAEAKSEAKTEKAKKGKFEVSPAGLAKLKELASGKDMKELKSAILKVVELKNDNALMNEIFSKGLLAELQKAGELILDTDSGKFV